MRFGRSAAEAAEEPSRGGGGGDFIRYPKDGDTTIRILQDPDEWLHYWEHFSPAGFSFPCPRGPEDPVDMCPGCASDNEKMKKVNKKMAFNVLTSFNGTEYVNAFKIGPMIADKLENRYKRFGTLTDRDYTITKFKTSGDRTDFDIEGGTPTPIDLRKSEWKDIEAMLQTSWDDAWGNPDQAEANKRASDAAITPTPASLHPQGQKRTVIQKTEPLPEVDSDEPPFEEEKVYQEADLRKMDLQDLRALVEKDLGMVPPSTLATPDGVVDWLMELQS